MKKIVLLLFLLSALFSEAQILKGTILNKPTKGHGLDTCLVTGVINYNSLGQAGLSLQVNSTKALIRLKNSNLYFKDSFRELKLGDIATKTDVTTAFANVVIDNSALWTQTQAGVIQSTNKVIAKELEIGTTMKRVIGESSVVQTTTGTETEIGSITIPVGKIIKINVTAIAYSFATAATFEHRTSFSNLNNNLVQLPYNFYHFQREDDNWNFRIVAENQTLKFLATGRDSFTVNWSYSYELITN